ncbi:hypothetical protein AVEN_8988-1 [Araneus ventricosus]|uniref:Uncharacterized protein n=1 Tax=Araneus ventricosus TaxID=182803 RepID=A0A4Y2STU0_ARAVE|nr:hypothetical protein AVEN_8988-1 [Araneus ventricosus]
MDSSAPLPRSSSLRMVGDMNDRPFISYLHPLRIPLITTRPTAFSPFPEQQPAEICPTSMEVAWPVTVGLGVRVLIPRTKQNSKFLHEKNVLIDRSFSFLILSLIFSAKTVENSGLSMVKVSFTMWLQWSDDIRDSEPLPFLWTTIEQK